MGRKKKKVGKDRLDKFYHLAKDQGYRSRAAFKLIQLNKKFNFLGRANVLIDLCAAPGSWMQVASKFMPVSRVIIGVDLDPIKPIPGVITLKQDITTGKCRSEIISHLKGSKADIVLHDGSPNVGTAWVQDAYAQTELTLSALKLAVEFLTSGGTFLTKVFRSADYNSLLWVFHQLFKKVTATKPPASRSTSAEIFVVCEEFLAPKKIDPRLLDPRSVFKEMDVPKDLGKIFSKKKSPRNRQGYDGDSMILFKKCSVGRFIHCKEPIRLLAEHNAITFEPEEGDNKEELEKFARHIKTTEEIRHCLQDLKLLSARDFKMLLKWRTVLRKLTELDKKEEQPEVPLVQLTEEQKQDLLQQEIEDSIKRQDKRKKKKLLEKQRKIQRFRLRQGIHANMENDFENPSDNLFNLNSIRRQAALDEIVGKNEKDVQTTPVQNDIDIEKKNTDENNSDKSIMDQGAEILDELQKSFSEDSESDIDSKEEPDDRHDRKTEQYLDLMYNSYISANEEFRKKISKRMRIRERKELAIPEDLTNFDKFSEMHDVEDELEFYDDAPDNELLVTPQEEASSKKASIWFDAKIFDDVEGENDDEEVINKMLQERQELLKKRKRESLQASESDQITKKRKIESEAQDNQGLTSTDIKPTSTKISVPDEDESFEEVPIEEKADDYSYDDPDDYDEQKRAEMLVLGSILKQSTQRAEVVDKTINRYMYPDNNLKLPDWFKDDEEKHNKPLLPVTKEMVEEYKQQMKAIDARSTKKVAEAKARKKKKYVQKLEKARSKAKSISTNSELSERDKIKQIQKVYKGQLNKVKPSKVYVVGRKLVGSKIPRGKNVRIKLVDPRLKKDKRGKKSSENKNKSRSKKRRTNKLH